MEHDPVLPVLGLNSSAPSVLFSELSDAIHALDDAIRAIENLTVNRRDYTDKVRWNAKLDEMNWRLASLRNVRANMYAEMEYLDEKAHP